MFSIVFHVYISDPSTQIADNSSHQMNETKCYSVELNTNSENNLNKTNDCDVRKWYTWLKVIDFYKVTAIYIMARLFFNLIQVYIPLYLVDTLRMAKVISSIKFN